MKADDRLRARRGGRKREGQAKAPYVAYFALDGDLEQRLDAVRGEMTRAAWMRNTFVTQLEADERDGTCAGLTPQDNPYDGGMPFGLPRPDPHVPGRREVPKKRRGSSTAEVKVASELRHIQVITLANAGKSREEISEITGYTKGTIGWIIRHELNKYKMASVQEYREFTLRKLLELMQIQQETIDNPGYVTSATGSVVNGPDGQPLIDKTERTRSVTEYRKLIESVRREVGTDAPSQRHVTLEQQQLDSTLKGLLAALVMGQQGALEDAVDAEIVSDEDGEGQGDEPAREGPGEIAADDAAGSESREQEEDDGRDPEDPLIGHE